MGLHITIKNGIASLRGTRTHCDKHNTGLNGSISVGFRVQDILSLTYGTHSGYDFIYVLRVEREGAITLMVPMDENDLHKQLEWLTDVWGRGEDCDLTYPGLPLKKD